MAHTTCGIDIGLEKTKQPSFQNHNSPIPSPETKHVCQSEGSKTACPDLMEAEHSTPPISVKLEPDPDPYFLSVGLFSRESTIHPDDHNIKLDLLDLKSEIKSELSTDEHFSFEDAELIVDPFKDCVKPEIEVNRGLPEPSRESLGALQVDDLQHQTTQVKENCRKTEVLVLTEPDRLVQDGRVCHLLRYRTQGGKALQSKSKVKIHTGQKPSGPRFPCSQCEKTFAFSSGLRVHMRAHTGERPYNCPICCKDFSRSDFLAMHIKSHGRTQTGERIFECDLCEKKLTSRGFLQLHKERSHGIFIKGRGEQKDTQFPCGSCGKVFKTKRSLKTHKVIHSDVRPYACTQCGHSFNRSSSLKKHMRIHTKERPYSCGVCGKTFPYTHSLKTHVEIHKRPKK